MKNRTAAKGRKLFFLAAVCLLSTLLLSSTVEASRSLPASLAPALDVIPKPAEVLESSLSDPPERFWLFDDLSLPLRPLELVEARKNATGVSSRELRLNIWQTGCLGQICSGPSFQGLWTDPVTGIAYARNRWYDARTASWLSEDPKGAVDSPNLYAFVAWGPHVGRDPMGLEGSGDWLYDYTKDHPQVKFQDVLDFIEGLGEPSLDFQLELQEFEEDPLAYYLEKMDEASAFSGWVQEQAYYFEQDPVEYARQAGVDLNEILMNLPPALVEKVGSMDAKDAGEATAYLALAVITGKVIKDAGVLIRAYVTEAEAAATFGPRIVKHHPIFRAAVKPGRRQHLFSMVEDLHVGKTGLHTRMMQGPYSKYMPTRNRPLKQIIEQYGAEEWLKKQGEAILWLEQTYPGEYTGLYEKFIKSLERIDGADGIKYGSG